MHMDSMPWDEYPETQVWLVTKKNKWSYWRPFKTFMDFVGVSTPVELLDIPEDKVRKRLADFRDMNAGQYATKTVNLYSTAVTSFFDRHGKDVRVKRIRQYVSKSYKTFTQSEIRQLVKYADIRTKAIIHCAYSSGARISSILGLKVGRIDLKADPPVELKFYSTETKYNVAYTTFLSKEAIEAVDLYLRDRSSRKDETITPESMLFVTKYGGTLTANAAGQQLHTVMDKAGVTYDKEHERVGNHCFRNAFQRNLQRAGVNQAIIELMMGHSQNSTHQRYTIGHTVEELRKAHMQADWSLGEMLIDGVEELQKEVEFLRGLIEESQPGRVGRFIDDIILRNDTPYDVVQISVEELSEYIARGYEIATPNPLPTGEYIVRRRRR